MNKPNRVIRTFIIIWQFLSDILYPKRCLICNKFGLLLCGECASKIKLIKTALCPICGSISAGYQICKKCRKHFKYLHSVVPVCHYGEGPLKQLIYCYKYEGVIELSEVFAELMLLKTSCLPIKNTIIVPVPLHFHKHNSRGFNQSEEIAKILSKKLKIQLSSCLKKVKNTTNQALLARNERLRSQIDAYSMDQNVNILLRGKTVLLIDDISTTCSTLNECAKVLKSNGARKVVGCVIARNI